jgi:hypothetical protein
VRRGREEREWGEGRRKRDRQGRMEGTGELIRVGNPNQNRHKIGCINFLLPSSLLFLLTVFSGHFQQFFDIQTVQLNKINVK